MDKQRTIFDVRADLQNQLVFNCDNCRKGISVVMAIPGLMLCIACISAGEFSETSVDGFTVPRNPFKYEN